jgi:hypothetical protein
MRSPTSTERGQASLEWLAVVALVATLLGLGAALAQASSVGRRVTREMARAICLVGDGDCRRDQEPCVQGTTATRQDGTVAVVIVRLGADKLGLVERRSDGTFAATVAIAGKGGLEAKAGLSAKVAYGDLDLSVGGEVTASLLGRLGRGKTWIVDSAEAAQRVLDHGGAGRDPDITSGDGSFHDVLSATVSGSAGGKDAEAGKAGYNSDQEVGWTRDRRTGHRTAYVKASWSGSASVAGESVLGLSGGGETYAFELDETGRPVDLRVIAVGRFGGSHDLPSVAQPVAGLLPAGADDRSFEVTSHLDLTDPDNLAAARELLDAISRKQGRAKPSQALRRRIDERGGIEVRVLAEHATSSPKSFAITADVVTLGLDADKTTLERHLLAAASRGLDGEWIERSDCALTAAEAAEEEETA